MWNIRTDTETSHILWGNPLSGSDFFGGSIKALFIAPYEASRECVELSQRLEMSVDSWVVWSPYSISVTDSYNRRLFGGKKEDRLVELENKLKNQYDLVVVANTDWDMIPAELQAKIFKQVENGAGILFAMPRGGNTEFRNTVRRDVVSDDGFILSGVPLVLLEKEYTKPIAGTYGYGVGRVVEMRWPAETYQKVDGHSFTASLFHCLTPIREMTQERMVTQEYYYSVVARAAIWATKRETNISFTDWPETQVDIGQDTELASFELGLLNVGEEESTTISIWVCDQ